MAYIHFNKKILSNGLCVIHHADHTSPFVVVNILYKVGAMHEHPEKTGFAHLFEHLMFEGTPDVPYFDGPLQEAGGENNAFTNNDYTNYYDLVPAVNAEIPFWLEADRMKNLAINRKSLTVQQKVVIEEFKENYINQPYGDSYHLLRELMYEHHPYKWPTIGKDIQHIKDASLKEVKAFFNKYYVPNNAILVISGDIEEENAFSLAEKWFGDIPKGKFDVHPSFDEPEQKVAKSITHSTAVPQDAIFLGFKMPARLEDGYYAADVTTDILSTGTSSRLNQRLIKEQGIFSEIDAYISGSNDVGMFVIEGKVSKGVDVQQALAGIWQEINLLSTQKVENEELEKVKNKMLTYMNFSDASLLNRSISLAYYEMLGDAHLINEEENRYENVSSEDILQFCSTYLRAEKSNTLLYLSNILR